MKKIVILNVGGALSCYGDFDGKQFIIDLGNKNDFSPVDDFLIPLFENKNTSKISYGEGIGKYRIEQLFLSHLDQDHIADYEKFRKKFHTHYMTCPSDNSQLNNLKNKRFMINRDLIGEISDIKKIVLDDMEKRNPHNQEWPLESLFPEISLNFIHPKKCENEDTLKPGYANNISLTLFINIGSKTVLFPGDLLKDGTKYLIQNNPKFRKLLKENGVDYLIAPHHGLKSSFSQYLFDTIKGNKVRLNIISEKIKKDDSEENRDVDTRYNDEKYSTGKNSLGKYGVKTSLGHIVIDFDTPENEIKQFKDINDVINEFTN